MSLVLLSNIWWYQMEPDVISHTCSLHGVASGALINNPLIQMINKISSVWMKMVGIRQWNVDNQTVMKSPLPSSPQVVSLGDAGGSWLYETWRKDLTSMGGVQHMSRLCLVYLSSWYMIATGESDHKSTIWLCSVSVYPYSNNWLFFNSDGFHNHFVFLSSGLW